MNKYQKALNQIYEDTCYIEGDIIKHNNDEEFEELRELVNKTKPKKPKEVTVGGFGIARNYFCECGHQIRNNQKHCDECMQAVDWEREDTE